MRDKEKEKEQTRAMMSTTLVKVTTSISLPSLKKEGAREVTLRMLMMRVPWMKGMVQH